MRSVPYLSLLLSVVALPSLADAGAFKIPDTPFAREIVAEWPELETAKTDWERVNLLRCWAWAHTDFVHRQSCGAPTDNRFHLNYPVCPPNQDYTPSRFYKQFKEGVGAVWIAECALGLAALYREFGYRAEYIAIGGDVFFGVNFHAQTLVEIEHHGQQIVVLQDPTFNLSFTDRTWIEPLDYFEMVRRLARFEHTSIRARGPDYTAMRVWPRVYFPDEQIEGRTPEAIEREFWPILDNVAVPETVNGNIVFHSPRTLEKWLRCEACDPATGQPKEIITKLVSYGYPPDWMYLHLRLKGISNFSLPKNDWNARYNSALSLGEGERIELTSPAADIGANPAR